MYAHKHPEPTDPRVGPAIVYLIVGLPGAGKTTHAKELETSASAPVSYTHLTLPTKRIV